MQCHLTLIQCVLDQVSEKAEVACCSADAALDNIFEQRHGKGEKDGRTTNVASCLMVFSHFMALAFYHEVQSILAICYGI